MNARPKRDQLRFAGIGTFFPLPYLTYGRRSTLRPTSTTPSIALITNPQFLCRSPLNMTNANS